MTLKAGHLVPRLYSHDIILVLFYWIIKQDYIYIYIVTGGSLYDPEYMSHIVRFATNHMTYAVGYRRSQSFFIGMNLIQIHWKLHHQKLKVFG